MIMMNPVASSCGARGCIDVYDPVRTKKLKEWAESDAKFLKRLSIKKHEQDHHHQMMILNKKKKKSHEDDREEEEEGLIRFITSERSESLDRFTFRQRYLRSYTFYNPDKEDNSKDTIKKIITKKLLPKKKKKSQKEALNSSSPLRHCFNFLLSCVAQVHVRAH